MTSRLLGKLELSGFQLGDDIAYLNALPKFDEEYDEFGQGYWKNISLINSSGDASDTQYKNASVSHPTDCLLRSPEIRRLIETCFRSDNLKMVRARNLIAGMVIPHRDFIELDPKQRYFRVFLPIEENTTSYHSDASGVFQMRTGELWCLDASIDHAAVNFSAASRQFLCFDFAFDEPFNDLDILTPYAPFTRDHNPLYVNRAAVPQSEKEEIIDGLSSLLSRQTFKDLLFAVSKLHFYRDISVSECYDWIIAASERVADVAIKDKALRLRRYLVETRELNERFELTSWA
jgi:hypothetical protein